MFTKIVAPPVGMLGRYVLHKNVENVTDYRVNAVKPKLIKIQIASQRNVKRNLMLEVTYHRVWNLRSWTELLKSL